MEFVDLSRYITINKPHIPKFSELRNMKPVYMVHELKIVEEPENIDYIKFLASKGIEVVPIRRKILNSNYENRTDFPRRILFEMTSRCNFLCRMCPQQNLKRPRMDMPKEIYKKIIDEINFYGVEGLWLYHLGESLLHPDFNEIINYISTKNNLGIIWISTNGEFFTEDKIRNVLNSNIDYINFSAHAVTEETYNTVAKVGKFKIVTQNLETFIKMKGIRNLPKRPFLHCQMIEQETTKHEVDAFIKKYYKYVDIVSINMLEYVNMPNNSFGLKQRERKPLTSCTRVGRNDCFICSNGDVTLCDAAYNGEICLGNINDQSLYDIWNGETRKKILALNAEGNMSKIGFCRSCTDYDI